MITPSYAPTATERVLPRMALDFTTATLDARVTVTRALNTATRINSSGLVEIVNANLPRFDFNPITQQCRGLLIEESRFNAHTSSGLYDATWLIANVTVNAIDIATSPTGTGTKFLETTANAQHLCDYARFFHTASTTVTHSRWFRAGLGRDYIYMNVDDNSGNGGKCDVNLAAGTIISTSNSGTGTNSTSSIQAFPDGWYRVSISTQFTAASGQSRGICGIYQDATLTSTYVGDTSKGLYVTGAQLEAGAFATSYIPTTTTSLTRNADDVSMTGTNFSSWYNASEGALSVKYLKTTTQVSGRYVARFFSPTVGAGVSYWINANGIDTRYWIGATNASLGNGSLVNVNTGAFAYKTASSTGALNGAANVANAGTVPLDVTELRIGDAGGINAHVQRILYWPFALTAAEIRANSKG